MQSGAANEISPEYPNRQKLIFTLMPPATNHVCLGGTFVGGERDLPCIRNATFVTHKPIAILTTTLFLFQIAKDLEKRKKKTVSALRRPERVTGGPYKFKCNPDLRIAAY